MKLIFFLYGLIILSIIIGVYFIFIEDNSGLAAISFIFSILVFFVTQTSFITESKANIGNSKEELQPETHQNDFNQTESPLNSSVISTKSQNTSSNVNSKTEINEEKILGDSFSGNIIADRQADYYEYVPIVSGVYRFDLDSSDVHTDYKFYIYSENGDKEVSTLYSNGGETISLDAGRKYRIIVEQYFGKPQYTITIGVPKEVKNVEGAVIKGSLSYTDQEDVYTYIAPVTGKYRFDYSSSDVQCNYEFYIYTQNNRNVATTFFSDEGETVDLVRDETYTFVVKQDSGYLDYSINIGVPHDVQVVDGNSFSGDMTYINQCDRYTYIAPTTGKYRFDFISDNIEYNYDFNMYALNNENLIETSYLSGGETIELEEGETYKIEIVQNSGIGNYTINIGVPNNINSVEEDIISGTLYYTDQEDRYTYIASISGNYEFFFEIDDVNADYDFYIYASNNKKLAETSYLNKSEMVQLEEGEVYTIIVGQSIEFPSYQINIAKQ